MSQQTGGKMKKYTEKQWKDLAVSLYGPDQNEWEFVCPSCGHVTKMKEWVECGAQNAIAFSCIGRFNGKGDDKKTFGKKGGPCMYAGGGLFAINPVMVVDSEEKKHFVFDFSKTNHVATGEKAS